MKNILLLSSFILLLMSCAGNKPQPDVIIKTSMGDITIDLYDETPIHKENFLKLATDGYLNGTLFHRCIPGFMIQGGDPTSKDAAKGARLGNGGPGYTLPAEIGLPHYVGTLCAARTGGPNNPEKKSSGSQFYIVEGRLFEDPELDKFEGIHNAPFTAEQRTEYKTKGGAAMLDTDYTVFGIVLEGMDVVKAINAVARDKNNRPLDDIAMEVVIPNTK